MPYPDATNRPNSDAEQRGGSLRRWIGLAAAPIAFAWFTWGPAPGGTTHDMRSAAALTAVMAVLWICESIPLAATALLPIVFLPASGLFTAAQAAAPYANDMIFLFIGGFILANALEQTGLHRRLVRRLLKAAGGGRRRLVLAVMAFTAFISLWISNTAAALLAMPLGVSTVQAVAPRDRRFGAAMVLGVASAASIGGLGTPFGSTPNLLLVSLARRLYGIDIGFADWSWFGLPLVVAFTLMAWGVLAFVLFPPDESVPTVDPVERASNSSPLRLDEALIGLIFALTALGWVFREPWKVGGARIGLAAIWPWISDGVIAIAGAVAVFVVPATVRPLRFAIDWNTGGRIPWDVVLLFGGGLSLAEGIQRSGLDRMLVSSLAHWGGSAPPWLVLAAACLLALALSEIASNTATAALLLPLMGSMAVGMGQHPMFLMLPVMIATSLGFMLPAATPPNALALGTGYVTVGQLAKAGLALNVVGLALGIAACRLLGFPALGVELGVIPPGLKPGVP